MVCSVYRKYFKLVDFIGFLSLYSSEKIIIISINHMKKTMYYMNIKYYLHFLIIIVLYKLKV